MDEWEEFDEEAAATQDEVRQYRNTNDSPPTDCVTQILTVLLVIVVVVILAIVAASVFAI